MTTPVKVHIFGQPYAIRGELEESYVQRLAAYVDQQRRVRELQHQGPLRGNRRLLRHDERQYERLELHQRRGRVD